MKILIIGACGSMGRRYQAIVKHLGHEVELIDPALGSRNKPIEEIEFDKAIIACPTEYHAEWCRKANFLEKKFLCEKPLSKDINECRDVEQCYEYGDGLSPGYVVNNYVHTAKILGLLSPYQITYDYYNAGKEKEEVEFNCCQLIYMDPKAVILTEEPVYRLTINGTEILHGDVEKGYVKMVDDFIAGRDEDLWTLTQGREMTEAVYAYIDRNSGANR